MIVICDARPLIFLAKLNRLDLIASVLQGEIVVLDCVRRELLTENIHSLEEKRLRHFLETARTPVFNAVFSPSFSLSPSDQSTLSWAIQNHADWLLADERLLRRIAREQGIAVVGFCGLLVQAAKAGLLSAEEVRADIDTAISRHHFRISIRLYQAILHELP